VVARDRLPSTVACLDLVVRLVAVALAGHPDVNAGSREVNVALAPAAGAAPDVVAGADRLDVLALASRRAALAVEPRVRRGRGASRPVPTFTVWDLGGHGVDAVLPAIAPGQSAALGVGRVADRVVPVQGRPQVRPVLSLGLTCEVSSVDAVSAAVFLSDLVDLLEEPAGRL